MCLSHYSYLIHLWFRFCLTSPLQTLAHNTIIHTKWIQMMLFSGFARDSIIFLRVPCQRQILSLIQFRCRRFTQHHQPTQIAMNHPQRNERKNKHHLFINRIFLPPPSFSLFLSCIFLHPQMGWINIKITQTYIQKNYNTANGRRRAKNVVFLAAFSCCHCHSYCCFSWSKDEFS